MRQNRGVDGECGDAIEKMSERVASTRVQECR